MQIERIQINSFGKLNNLDLEFDNGINVVNGKNETGKSTLADYIRCVFYGVSKNKNGKEYSDYERYSPWNNQKFAGSITYKNDGETFNLFRDFSKNKATLTNMYGEDITASFNVAKNKGAEIGLEQFKMDEETFENSILVRQNQVQVDTPSQNSIIQKIGNVIQTGDESLSYEEINKKLEKVLNDEVGTDRTTTKPKFMLKKEVQRLEEKQKELESINNRNAEIKRNKELLNASLSKMNKEYKNITEVFSIKKKYEDQIKEERLINDIEYKNKLEAQKERKKKKRNTKIAIITIATILLIVSITATLISHVNWLWIICGFILIATILYAVLFNNKKEEKIENKFFEKEKEILQNESKELKLLTEKIKIKKSITEKSSLELSNLMSDLEKEINNNELESHKLKIEEESIKDKTNNFNEVVEDLEYNKEALDKVLQKEEVINLGIDILHDSYEEIKKKIIPSIEEDIKYTVSKTTNGKYTELKYNDKDGLVCKNEYGELTPLNKLSLGTIDQMYLGFRMAIADKYSNLPLIFDETFVYFDDDRLENILKTISDISSEKQIIILSCSERETRMLDKIKVKYKKINI